MYNFKYITLEKLHQMEPTMLKRMQKAFSKKAHPETSRTRDFDNIKTPEEVYMMHTCQKVGYSLPDYNQQRCIMFSLSFQGITSQ